MTSIDSRSSLVVWSILFLLGIGCGTPDSASDASLDDRAEALYESTDLTAPESFTSGVEGPAVGPDGHLYAVNYRRQQTIGRVTPEGEASVFIELPDSSTGNGIRFNSAGDMFIADYVGHNVLRVDMESREISVFAHEPSMNQPNDLAIGPDDRLYASDPDWGESTGQIWRIDPDGSVTLLEKDMGTTNGIEVSPDGQTLYVNESRQRNVWAYDLADDGRISNKRLLIDFSDYGMDGMRADADGNLYITRHGMGTVAKVSPRGEVVREISLEGAEPTNLAFGGPEGRTVYVTVADRGNIESFRVERPGRSWRMAGE